MLKTPCKIIWESLMESRSGQLSGHLVENGMEASLIPQSNHGIMDKEEEGEGDLCYMSSVFEDSSSDSNGSSSLSSASSQSLNDEQNKEGPLYEISSLMAQLPCKRGLSNHYQGKSQSFTCLSSVRCLEDLAKHERPVKKKLKPSKSCEGGLNGQRSMSIKGCSRAISKKASRQSRPPLPPPQRRNSCLYGQTLLFA